MANEDELRIKILADISGLKSDMEMAKKSIGGFEKKTKKAAKGFKGSTDGMLLQVKRLRADLGALTFAIGSAAGAYIAFAQSVNRGRELSQLATRVGVNRVEFAALSKVVESVGAESEDLFDVFKDLGVRITDAAGGAKAYDDVLKQIGLDSKALVKLAPEQQFLRFADALKKANPEIRRFAIDELVSDPGIRMIEVLSKGSSEIENMTSKIKLAGKSMSELDFQSLEKAAKAQREFNITLEKFATLLSTKVAPAVSASMKGWNMMLDTAPDMKKLSSEYSKLQGEMDKVYKTLMLVKSGKSMNPFKSQDTQIRELTDKWIGLSSAQEKVERQMRKIGKSQDPMLANIKGFVPFGPQNQPEGAGAEEDLNKVFEEEMAKSGATLATMGSKFLQNGENVGADSPEYQQDKEVKDLLLENLLDYQENEWNYKNAQRERELEANRGFWDSMLTIDEKARDANAKLWESGWKGKQMVASKFLGQITGLMNTNSRKQFEIGKAAAIAQVAIDTPKTAMSAYSAMAGIPFIGPALGVAAAAAAVASGVSQIQNIKSQTFGGGSAGAGGLGGAGDVGAAGAGGGQQAAPENVLDATFNIQGSSVSADQVRTLGSSLNEYIEDGFRIRSVQVV